MNKYELVVILNANLSQEEKDEILRQVTDSIVKGEGKIINNKVWLERQKMTYRIKKCIEGTYYLINFEAEGSVTAKIRQLIRLNEKILRFLIVKAE